MEQAQGIKTWQWVVTAIIIIVLIIIGVLVVNNKSTEAPAVTNETPNTETPVAVGANRIVMSDQYPGNVVYLSSVQLASPGFVVVQKDAAGKPGAVIGSVYLPAGTNPGKITLTQPMVNGSLYYASLYSDTNNNQKFDMNTDQPVTDSSGVAIVKTFRASTSASNDIKG